jgi:hypothetical protein
MGCIQLGISIFTARRQMRPVIPGRRMVLDPHLRGCGPRPLTSSRQQRDAWIAGKVWILTPVALVPLACPRPCHVDSKEVGIVCGGAAADAVGGNRSFSISGRPRDADDDLDYALADWANDGWRDPFAGGLKFWDKTHRGVERNRMSSEGSMRGPTGGDLTRTILKKRKYSARHGIHHSDGIAIVSGGSCSGRPARYRRRTQSIPR